jgi:hypothetical protein
MAHHVSDTLTRVLRRVVRRVVDRLGYRGAALLILGFTFILVGVGVIGNPAVMPELFFTRWPVWVRVCVWVVPSLVAWFAAVVHRPRWHQYGYAALFLPPAERLAGYGGALFIDVNLRWLAGFGVYFAMCGLIALIAAWPEPPTTMYRPLLRRRVAV